MKKKNNLFKSEDEFDIILILGSNEELFKKYVEKIHPDIIRNELLQPILKYQINDFNTNRRFLKWEKSFYKAFPGKANEEPFKKIFLKLGKKHLEDILTQSPELLEKRLRHLLERAKTNKAVLVYAKTGDLKVLHENLDNAKSIIRRRGIEIVEKDLSKVPDELPFLIPGRIVKGLTFIVGRGGVGKGAFTTGTVIAAVTAGGVVFEEHKLEQGLAFLFSEGEDLPRTVLDRIEINKGNVENFKWLEVKEEIEGEEEEDFLSIFSLKYNLPDLIRKLKQTPEEKLTNSVLVIDGIGTFMGMEKALDAYSDMAVRRILTPLGRMAEKFNMAIIIIGHLNKDTNAELIRAVMASVAFPNVCRATYAVIMDEEEEEKHYFIPIKWNLKELYGTGIEFRIEETTDRIIITGKLSVEQVRELKGEQEAGEARSLGKTEDTDRFLERELNKGYQRPKDMVKKLTEDGICGRDFLYKRRHIMGKKGLIETITINGIDYWTWKGGATVEEVKAPEKEVKEPEEVKEQSSDKMPEYVPLTPEQIDASVAKLRADAEKKPPEEKEGGEKE